MGRVQQLQVLKGLAVNIPVLFDGEFYFASDTGQLYVGFGGINFSVGAPVMATVEINGSANPTHFIEPNVDGSINVTIPGTPTVNANATIVGTPTVNANAMIIGTPSVNATIIGTPAVNATLVAGGSVSLGTATGKTAVLKTGQLTTTAVTANQVVLTYTVTAGKTLYLEYIEFSGRLTAVSATASVLGTAILQVGGVTSYTETFVNPTTSDSGSQRVLLMFTEPIPISAATAVAVLTTPSAATSMLWTANFGGYEK